LDIHVISVRNNADIGVGIGSCLQDVLKAEGEKEHAAGVSLTYAALRQEGRGVKGRSVNEEVSVLVVNPPGVWEKLGGAAGNSGKYSGTVDLVERIAKVHLNRDTSRVCTYAKMEGVSERWRPARDPRTELQRGQSNTSEAVFMMQMPKRRSHVSPTARGRAPLPRFWRGIRWEVRSTGMQAVGQGEKSIKSLDDSGVISAIKGKKDII
jgi:hypothetical protein